MKKNYLIGTALSTTAIYLPVEVREALKLKPDEEYELEVKDNSIVFTDPATARRRKWIDTWFNRYRFDKAAHMNTMGNITAVELYGEVGISKPSPTDKYDEKTGIAVAYAKAHGADIPKYI